MPQQEVKYFLCYAGENEDLMDDFVEKFKAHFDCPRPLYDKTAHAGNMHKRFQKFASECHVAILMVNAKFTNFHSYANEYEVPILLERQLKGEVIVVGIIFQDAEIRDWNSQGNIYFFQVRNNELPFTRRDDGYGDKFNRRFAVYEQVKKEDKNTYVKELKLWVTDLINENPQIFNTKENFEEKNESEIVKKSDSGEQMPQSNHPVSKVVKVENILRPVRVFLSYAHQDQNYTNTLLKHLRNFMGGKGILWYDLMIKPGDEWKKEIWVRLHQADLVLFLMSSDSIDSGFIWEVELQKTFERYDKGEVEFIPIYLRNCNWREIKDLSRFQVIPRDNKPIIHSSFWSSSDEPFELVSNEVIEKIKIIWQRINNKIIEQNRPKRFLGILDFLKNNPHFFDMGKIAKHSTNSEPEDFLYFIGIANHLKDLCELIRLADENGVNWVEETLEAIEFFNEVSKQIETVFQCSDYVWDKISNFHFKALISAETIEKNIGNYIATDWSKMDLYKSKYALPFSFILDEYQHLLRELAQESLSAQ